MEEHHLSRCRRRRKTPFTPVIALALLACVLFTARPSAQAPPQVFRVSKDLVLVDVIATGPDGRPVTDLRAEELVLTEDGKPQRILDLQFASGARPRDAAGGTAADAPGGVVGEAVLASVALASPAEAPAVVVAFDMRTMRVEDLQRARVAVLDTVRQATAGTRMMFVSLDRGLVVRQPLTTDPAAVASAVEALAPALDAEALSFDGFVDEVDRTCGLATDGPDRLAARNQAIGVGRAYLADVRLQMSTALDALGALSRLLAPVPGRKHVVYYSAGYPTRPVEAVTDVIGSLCGDRAAVTQTLSASLDTVGWMQSAFDDANRAQVSIYAVDPRGLVSDGIQARSPRSARATSRGGQLPEVRRQFTEVQQFLRSVAGETGGVAWVNTNDIARGFREAIDDARQYHLLAFEPQGSRKAGRYYRISLKTTRPGVHLRYRQGYLWLDAAQRAERDVALAMRFPQLYGDPPIGVDASVEGRRVKVAIVVPTAGLRFTPVGGEHHNDIAVSALLRDAEGKVAGGRYLFAKDVAMKMTAERLAGMLAHENIEIPGEGAAPRAGQYELVVVVRHSAGRISARSVALAVP